MKPRGVPVDVFSCAQFVLPLPEEHRFPMTKYSLLEKRVIEAGLAGPGGTQEPRAATDEQLTRVHDAEYVRKVVNGDLSKQEVRRMGFPWSPALVQRSRRSCGATIDCIVAAAQGGIAVNLAGGTHHAFADCGEGYCVFNDAAVAARFAQEQGLARRVLIVDCDVHQGNGTASIFADDSSVFTFSIHGARNFPYRKERSDIDIALDDGTQDDEYLRELERGLTEAMERSQAALAIYLAGADPFHGDRFGRLALTKEGLAARDRMVLSRCRQAGMSVVVTMSGGYAPNVEDIVDIHFQTVAIAAEFARCQQDNLLRGVG